MSQNQDDIDDIPSLVPERDELASHRKVKRDTSAARAGRSSVAPAAETYVGGGTSGVVVFFLTLLTLGLVATAGGAFYFFRQGQQSQADLLTALNRITSLEATLNDMDAATKESSLGLLEKVDTSMSEIRKLWDARNAVKKEVETLTASMAAVQKAAKDLETALSAQGGTVTQQRTAVTALQSRLEEISKNFAGMGNLGQQLTQLNADLNRTKNAMDQVQKDVEGRLKATEDDIESININRLQLNQTLNALQNSINQLQQRVGQ